MLVITRTAAFRIASLVLVGVLLNGASCSRQPAAPPVAPEAPARVYPFAVVRPSAPPQAQNAAVLAYYRAWKSAFVRQSCGSGAYQVFSPDARYSFVAEAQGYGMVIAASMHRLDPEARTVFDGLLTYVLAHPSRNNTDLAASEQDETCTDQGGGNSATDGDMDIAYALLLADRLWGSSGRYDYRDLAVRRIRAIKASTVHPDSNLMLLGDWSKPSRPELFSTSRTSDWNLQYFQAFENATGDTGWSAIRTAHRQAINRIQSSYSPATGLLPDFVQWTAAGGVAPVRGKVLESDRDGDYNFNACRTPWRIGVDAITSGDAASTAAAIKINKWFTATTGGDPDKIRSGYTLSGTAYGTANDIAFWAPLAVTAMADPAGQQWLDALWAKLAASTVDAEKYFGATIQMQVMLVATGNWMAL